MPIFSASGRTAKVAEKLAAELGAEIAETKVLTGVLTETKSRC